MLGQCSEDGFVFWHARGIEGGMFSSVDFTVDITQE